MRKVTVHFLFSKNEKIGSKLISWGTRHLQPIKDTPSHVALLIDNRWVFESTLEKGVHITSYKEWLGRNTELAKICDNTTHEYGKIKQLFKRTQGLKYDWFGVLYQGVCLIPSKLFGTKMPKKNRWASDSRYFCCEVMGELLKEDFSMASPVDVLMYAMKSRGYSLDYQLI